MDDLIPEADTWETVDGNTKTRYTRGEMISEEWILVCLTGVASRTNSGVG